MTALRAPDTGRLIRMIRLAFIAAAAFAFHLSFAGADAAELMHGQVVQIDGPDTILVRHGAFAGMPAMTMEFRYPKGQPLRVGDQITAAVDRTKEPWVLSNLHVRPGVAQRETNAQPQRELAIGDLVPNLAFTDQQSRRFLLSSLQGHRYAISLIYTRCQDARMCPLISAKYHQVQTAVTPASHLVEITLDPTFDTPAVLARYGKTFGADPRFWHLLTGNPPDIHAFTESLGVQTEFQKTGILHTERLIIVDAQGRIERFIDDPTWAPSDLVSILSRSDTPWQRFMLASHNAFVVCGERIGPGGRLAVHHSLFVLIPLGMLALLIFTFRFFGIIPDQSTLA
jgi:protein SCO1/2